MGLIKRYLKPAFLAVPRIVYWYFAWMRKYAKHPEKYSIEERYEKMHNAFLKVSGYLNIDVIVEGLENLPKDDNVMLVGNHVAFYDPLIIGGIIDHPTCFVGKIEISKLPVIPTGMKAIDSLLMDRSDLKKSLKLMQHIQNSLKETNRNWCIFPEGTRRKDSRLLLGEFHAGTFRAPMKAKKSIVPFAIVGSDRVFNVKPRTYKRYPVHVKFLPAITPKMYEGKSTDEVAKICQDLIQATISFDLRSKDHLEMVKRYPDKYKVL